MSALGVHTWKLTGMGWLKRFVYSNARSDLINSTHVFMWVWNLVSHSTCIQCVWEHGKDNGVRWVWQAAFMEEMRNVYKILAGTCKERRSVGLPQFSNVLYWNRVWRDAMECCDEPALQQTVKLQDIISWLVFLRCF